METLRTRGTELNSGVPTDLSGQKRARKFTKSAQNRVENPSKLQEGIFSGQKLENPPAGEKSLSGTKNPPETSRKARKVKIDLREAVSAKPTRNQKNATFTACGPMVRIPPPEPVRLTGVGSNPSGVPKEHCTLTLGPGTPKVQCTPTLAPGGSKKLPESRVPIPLLGSNDDLIEGCPNRGSHSHQVSMTMLESDHENTPHTCLSSPAYKGQRWITVKDQSCFHIGCFIVLGDIFAVKVVDKGSLILEESLPRDFSIGTHVRQLSQNEPTSSFENGFGHQTVKTPISEEFSSDSGGGVACLFENESDPAHGALERVRGDGVARTTLQIPVFIGQRKLRVRSYEGFSRHDIIILGEKFLAFIADFGIHCP